MKLLMISENKYTVVSADIIKRKLEEYIKDEHDVTPNFAIYSGSIHGTIPGKVDFTRSNYEFINDYLNRRGWNMILLQKRIDWSLVASPIAGERLYSKGGKVWHCTPLINLPIIMKKGIIPRSKHNAYGISGADHGPSAYKELIDKGLMKSDDPRIVHASYGGYGPRNYVHTHVYDAIRMACMMSARRKFRNIDTDVAVLELTLPKFVKLYLDPEDVIDRKMAYTFSHIKPDYISHLVTISKYQNEIGMARDPLQAAIDVMNNKFIT